MLVFALTRLRVTVIIGPAKVLRREQMSPQKCPLRALPLVVGLQDHAEMSDSLCIVGMGERRLKRLAHLFTDNRRVRRLNRRDSGQGLHIQVRISGCLQAHYYQAHERWRHDMTRTMKTRKTRLRRPSSR